VEDGEDIGPAAGSALFEVEFQFVGPLKRSTLETGHPDPEWEALGDVLYWSFSSRLQADRLRRSFLAELSWWAGLYVFRRKRFSTTSYDEHCLMVATGNLDRALHRGAKYLRRTPLPTRTLRILRLLRNVYEHWDANRVGFRKGVPRKAQAAKKLAEEFPDAEPWSLSYHEGDILLAGIVSLRSLKNELRKIEAAIHWQQRRLCHEGRHQARESATPAARADG